MAWLKFTRRGLAVSALGAGLAAVGVRRALAKASGPHDAYFAGLNTKVRELGVPVVVIDRARLVKNTAAILGWLGKLPLRVVVKSLPSLPLLDLIPSKRFMAFNTTMLKALWARDPAVDVLLGKPMPIAAVQSLFTQAPDLFTSARNTQWLIDSSARLAEYAAFAREHGLTLKVNLEIDVGLHRGGFDDAAIPAAALRGHEQLELAGLMGYEPHVARTPTLLQGRAWAHVQERYRAAVDAVRSAGFDPDALTLNSGGSLTFRRHAAGTAANEISLGSAFVLPSDFEQEGLEPAAFIATPVLKRVERAVVPGLEALHGLRSAVMPDTAHGVFVFGGNWLARPASPPGLSYSDLFGRSSNQELLLAGEGLDVQVGDCVFYRPTQSEAVLNAFGPLAVVDGGKVERWPVLG